MVFLIGRVKYVSAPFRFLVHLTLDTFLNKGATLTLRNGFTQICLKSTFRMGCRCTRVLIDGKEIIRGSPLEVYVLYVVFSFIR
jgi:hypothetical protein